MRWKRLEASALRDCGGGGGDGGAAGRQRRRLPLLLLLLLVPPLFSLAHCLEREKQSRPSLSLSRHSSIRRRSEICIWEKVLLLHTNARALTRHRACICLSRIYGDSCLCGRREREGRKEEESANSIRGGIQKMPREDLGAAEPAPTVSASRAAACDSSPTP